MICREPLQPALLTLTKVLTATAVAAVLSVDLLSYHVDLIAFIDSV